VAKPITAIELAATVVMMNVFRFLFISGLLGRPGTLPSGDRSPRRGPHLDQVWHDERRTVEDLLRLFGIPNDLADPSPEFILGSLAGRVAGTEVDADVVSFDWS
jgi:hypothetical protein